VLSCSLDQANENRRTKGRVWGGGEDKKLCKAYPRKMGSQSEKGTDVQKSQRKSKQSGTEEGQSFAGEIATRGFGRRKGIRAIEKRKTRDIRIFTGKWGRNKTRKKIVVCQLH